MSTNHQETRNPAAAADPPQPPPALTPEAVVEGLRAFRAQMGEMTPLTRAQRKRLREVLHTSNPVLQASINVIGALGNVSQAVGQQADEVRQLSDEANRWTAVEDELRTMLNGVVGANLSGRRFHVVLAISAIAMAALLVAAGTPRFTP